MSDQTVFGTDGSGAEPGPEREAPATAAAPAADAPRDDMTRLLGQIVSLMGQSPAHRHIFISDLEWLVLPPLTKRQVRIWRRRTERGVAPMVYASWAMVTEEVEKRLLQGQNRLRPNEWDGGSIPWLIDLVAPYGGGDAALNELVDQTFGGKAIKALVPTPGGGFAVRQIQPRSATQEKK
ncbi:MULTISPECIES: toxin-activating lysine-acyltransferase [Thalassobaculum]|uniref:RTX toxin-activating lysine-acyltransferase n=1 Tax=Thalassobaculum litoreum DSM 18839 TaxID=1123362 RepID=A0A8G2F2M3_9PROT|nr:MULTISPECIES: toxin-activating lysine-acyltransferase [Thalassobaculum]SDF58063.1 cytolysin-activating lysine-acyltransferase [Thalassobaculum litoreum DSM 18839]